MLLLTSPPPTDSQNNDTGSNTNYGCDVAIRHEMVITNIKGHLLLSTCFLGTIGVMTTFLGYEMVSMLSTY